MSIKVKFFARLREEAGIGEREIPFQPGMSVPEVWRQAGARGELPAAVLVAVNLEYARGAVTLKDGDEVAFFPAVTGG
jgi:molybdopterin synthase sulfur carrier subunit